MADLKNTFSWSFSANGDFEQCRRLRYWSKYGMWNGWSRNASDIQKAAYRLNKMDNRYSIMGQAAEEAVMWVLREKQEGRDATMEEAYQKIARPFLNGCWKQSKSKAWMDSPKQNCCLHEHYYARLYQSGLENWVEEISNQVKQCIQHFIDRALPRLSHIKREQEIPVASVSMGGDPESFQLNGIKVYAIPDYVYTEGDEWHIHDWKAGKQKESHREQLSLYALWAIHKHGVDPSRIHLYIEYLKTGDCESFALTAEELEEVTEKIGYSVGEMCEYLVQGNREGNVALPKEEWELSPDRGPCFRCKFYELCEPEFDEE